MTTFAPLGLLPALQNTLLRLGYQTPTPVQEQAIPPLLQGRDVMGIAQTGTGKTAAYALPILDKLHRQRKRLTRGVARVLILTPTRELAAQVAESFLRYAGSLPLRHAVVYGGVAQGNQVRALQHGVDVLIATPGRLLDLVQQGHIHLDRLETFVLDEADRMLDMGFIVDIQRVMALLPAVRQTLCFSATMPKEVASLVSTLLNDPVQVSVTPQATPVANIAQKVLYVEQTNKAQLLRLLLDGESIRQVLVFTRTRRGADRVAQSLADHPMMVDTIHGSKSQSARELALKRFRSGRTQVLVATDIAARGIDIAQISHVINYDLPNEPESYVHRIGRTGRAGREGMAISFCDTSERGFLRAIEQTIRCPVPLDREHPFHKEDAPPPAKTAVGRKKQFVPAWKGGRQNKGVTSGKGGSFAATTPRKPDASRVATR